MFIASFCRSWRSLQHASTAFIATIGTISTTNAQKMNGVCVLVRDFWVFFFFSIFFIFQNGGALKQWATVKNECQNVSCRSVEGCMENDKDGIYICSNDYLPRSQYVPSYSKFLHSHNGPESVDIQMPPCWHGSFFSQASVALLRKPCKNKSHKMNRSGAHRMHRRYANLLSSPFPEELRFDRKENRRTEKFNKSITD